MLSGNLGFRDDALWSSMDLLESYLPGPGINACNFVYFIGPPSSISWIKDELHLGHFQKKNLCANPF